MVASADLRSSTLGRFDLPGEDDGSQIASTPHLGSFECSQPRDPFRVVFCPLPLLAVHLCVSHLSAELLDVEEDGAEELNH